jgi:ubiquitin-conjugating enzyme E2 N
MEGPSPRIVKETKNLQNDPVPGITCYPDPNNFRHFFVGIEGTLFNHSGPQGTCYSGGKFKA